MKTIPIPFPLIEKMDGRSIVSCLLNNVPDITKQFLYGRCGKFIICLHRIFKSHCDCDNAVELAEECYVYVNTPLPPDNTSKLRRYETAGGDRPYPWFCTCSRNMCIDRYRKHKKVKFYSIDKLDYQVKDDSKTPLSIDDERLDDDTHVVVTYDARVVEDVLNHMSNKGYVELLRHRYFENLSVEETAKVMGITRKICDNRTTKARIQFKTVLRSRYSDYFKERDKNK